MYVIQIEYGQCGKIRLLRNATSPHCGRREKRTNRLTIRKYESEEKTEKNRQDLEMCE